MEIEIKDSYGIFKENPVKVELEEGLTLLTGPNGSGKSTFLKYLKDIFDFKEIKYFYLDCFSDFKNPNSLGPQDIYLSHLENGFLSEHEGYENLFLKYICRMRPDDNFIGKEFGIFIDGLDSGSDVIFFKRHINLFKTILKDAKKRGIKLYLVFTCNNFYYLTQQIKGKVLFLPTLEKFSLPKYSYPEFEKYIDDITLCDKEREKIVDLREGRRKRN